MPTLRFICIVLLITLLQAPLWGQGKRVPARALHPTLVEAHIKGNDTILQVTLPEVYIYAHYHFKNKQTENQYWRTVNDIKKVLPIARFMAKIIRETTDTLRTIHSQNKRDEYLQSYFERIPKSSLPNIENLTYNQALILIRIVDRDIPFTGYDFLKAYKGRASANFVQGIAKLCGANLKAKFGEQVKDEKLYRIIVQVENGML